MSAALSVPALTASIVSPQTDTKHVQPTVVDQKATLGASILKPLSDQNYSNYQEAQNNSPTSKAILVDKIIIMLIDPDTYFIELSYQIFPIGMDRGYMKIIKDERYNRDPNEVTIYIGFTDPKTQFNNITSKFVAQMAGAQSLFREVLLKYPIDSISIASKAGKNITFRPPGEFNPEEIKKMKSEGLSEDQILDLEALRYNDIEEDKLRKFGIISTGNMQPNNPKTTFGGTHPV
ncbi:MAG: hypothetical protein Solumvirus5_17 [Solumvirus sp.]|uniref:Uncharacterized protein n=1 Tax=Solumvirus sp. TaxID=2487773 RepID=A0A3G5AGV5_9VIRU|nr:MAG: hypothetical protein Solumvirus5_17 [Solumvirus sp.]